MNASEVLPIAAPVANVPVKEKKPPTAAQIAKIQREKNAAERIFRETGIRVPPSVGARLVKLEREGGNVSGFLANIRARGRGVATKAATSNKKNKPKTVRTTKKANNVPTVPTNESGIAGFALPAMNKPKTTRKSKKNTLMNTLLTAEERETLEKCKKISEKLKNATRKNRKNNA